MFDLLDKVNTNRIQIFAIIGSILFFGFVFELVRKRKIREQYALLWLFFGLVFLVISIWRGLLEKISIMLGIVYPPAAFLLILIIAIFLILIQYSVVISQLTEKTKKMSQEIGLLKEKLNRKKNRNHSKIKIKELNSISNK